MTRQYLFEARRTAWLALPFVVNQILQMSVITIDSLMAGADSDLTLAAVAQGAILFHLVMLVVVGLLMPVVAMVAQAYGRGDVVQLREAFQQSLWLALPLGLLALVVMQFTPQLMHWIGVDAQIIPPATQYLRIVSFSLPFIALVLPLRFAAEGTGNSLAIMLLTASSIPINVIGNYVFINGLWGLPQMGAAGLALSTVIAQIYFLAACWWFVGKHKKMRSLALFNDYAKPLSYVIKRIVRLGTPNALALLMEVSLFAVVMLLAGKLGVQIAAAGQVAFNYTSNVFMIPLGISMALTVRIGMARGKNDWTTLRIIGITGMLLGAGVMLVSMTIVFFWGQQIAELYVEDKAIVAIATGLLLIASFSQLLDGVQVCGSGALRGLEETKAPMYHAAIGYWILGIPCSVILAFPLGLGAQGLWWGVVVGLSAAGILNMRKFLKLTGKHLP